MKNKKIGEVSDFRLYLQEELIRRCKQNPQYSLRSFAKALDVSPSALSAMLNGKRPITEKSKKSLGLNLGLPLDEVQSFSQKKAKKSLYNQLTLDSFAVISDWYHYGILELLKVKNFKSDAKWVASKLGITKSEVNIAIERLDRLGMIEIDQDGNWQDVSGGFTTNIEPGLTSSASKKFQEQVLEKAITALKSVPLEKRDHTSMTMAINTKDLPEARERIKTFRRSLTAFLERADADVPDEVYHLSLALYPITNDSVGE